MVSQNQASLIISTYKSSINIRHVLKNGSEKDIFEQDVFLRAIIFESVDLYTGVSFEVPVSLSEQEKESILSEYNHIVNSCVELVKEQFASLHPLEIKEAFKMLASNKLKLDIKTYYGKFKPLHLAQVLRAYEKIRKAAICEYDKKMHFIESKKTEDFINENNEASRNDVILAYSYLLDYFRNTGDRKAVEKEIMGYWGKILVDCGVIDFDLEQKREFVSKSKKQANSELYDEMLGINTRKERKEQIKRIRRDFKENKFNEEFDVKWKAIYGKMIVIESIIKN